jgi:hypothetical protein
MKTFDTASRLFKPFFYSQTFHSRFKQHVSRWRLTNNRAFLFPLILSVFTASTVLKATDVAADQPEKPQPADCNFDDTLFEDRGDWINARLDCRYKNINSELWDLVEEVDNLPPGLFSEKQISNFKNERDRVEKERKKTTQAGGFKGIAKRQDSICQIMELDDGYGDADGICEPGENCAEVLDDGIGDEDGICKPLKGKKKEVCIQICDQDVTSAVDENFDLETLETTEANLESVEGLMEASREQVIQMNIAMNEMSSMQAKLGEGFCADLLSPEGLPPGPPSGAMRFTYVEMQGLLAGTNVADWAHAACDSGAEQSVFGTNAAAVCTVLAVAAGILDTVFDGFELQDDTVTGMRLDAAVVCLEQLDKQSSDTLKKLGGIEEKLNQVIELLNTPQGRRQDFPLKP